MPPDADTATPSLRSLSQADAERAAALLDAALDLEPAARADWLRALGAHEPALAGVVAGLLSAAQARTGGGPETADLIARRLQRGARAEAPSLAGRRFGPWRVTGLLGHGGMGSVWRAERADGLFERAVALKLVHPGLFGPAPLERFARERRILAGLVHPNIARLLDAGVAEDGQPYLALELVDGTPLDQHCKRERLAPAGRIVLMQQVLGAVQHAHQNLVIHRDLKPANILVDAAGQVRLLDFGIAKLMADGGVDETELTRVGGRALTPHYASPEQTAGRTVGTASDVYALGVVLHELLCGVRPEREAPRRPSQCKVTPEAAAERGTTPRALAQALAGDLDTIVLKALEPDPADRYPTADALRQDLQRWLDGEPVQARPAGAAYRLGKFVRRHRAGVVLAAGVSALLVGAAAVSLWQADSARRAAAEAARESQRAQAVQRFLLDVFGANSLRQGDPVRARQATARELLDAGAERAGSALAGSPAAQEAVFDALADLYFQLELPESAARMRRARIGALERAYGADDLRVAEAWLSHATDVSDSVQRGEAAAGIARARAIVARHGEAAARLRGWIEIESARLTQYTDLAAMRVQADAALALFRARAERWTDLHHALQIAARARHFGGDAAGAIALHEEAAALAKREEPAAPTWLVTPYVQIAEAEIARGRIAAAESRLREALAISRRLSGDDAASTLQTQVKLGALLHTHGRTAEGWALLQDAEARVTRPGAAATPDAVGAVNRFVGGAALERGEFERARRHLAAEVADLRRHYPDSLPLARTLPLLAGALTGLGRLDDSQALLDEADALLQRVAGPQPAPWLARTLQAERARLAAARG